jgi:hypothetical protein
MDRANALCPSTVPGAVTTLTNLPQGVQLDITGPDPAAAHEIEKRARFLADAAGHDPKLMRGDDRGWFAGCPVVAAKTVVTIDALPMGVRVTVVPRDPSEVGLVQREAHARNARLAGAPASPRM